MSIIEDKDLLSIPQAAELIGISAHTARLWANEGRFPDAVRLGRKLLIPRASLDAVFKPVVPGGESSKAVTLTASDDT
ncbi:MAG: helix-turn-helix domain-containing protein [Polyangiaceae bacterium]|nr:helix-turn-helix domain-containing protein [Polyangiaceae bacterium]